MFAVLKVNGTIEYKDIDSPNYNILLNHLHPDSFGYEHPTNIEGIWMLEDDAFEYINEENRERNINKLGGKFITREAPIYGDCILFRPGKNFPNGSFEDIKSLTDEDIDKINSKINNPTNFIYVPIGSEPEVIITDKSNISEEIYQRTGNPITHILFEYPEFRVICHDGDFGLKENKVINNWTKIEKFCGDCLIIKRSSNSIIRGIFEEITPMDKNEIKNILKDLRELK